MVFILYQTQIEISSVFYLYHFLSVFRPLSSMVWEQIRAARKKQSTSPHSLARPGQCVSASSPPMAATQPREVSTSWHQLEEGIAMVRSISPILFTAVFEAILAGSRQVACRVRAQSRQPLTSSEHYCTWTMLPLFSNQPPALLGSDRFWVHPPLRSKSSLITIHRLVLPIILVLNMSFFFFLSECNLLIHTK